MTHPKKKNKSKTARNFPPKAPASTAGNTGPEAPPSVAEVSTHCPLTTNFPPELLLKIFSLLDKNFSTCLGVTCKQLYATHRGLHGKVILTEKLCPLLKDWMWPRYGWNEHSSNVSGSMTQHVGTYKTFHKRVDYDPNHRIYYRWRVDLTVEWKFWGEKVYKTIVERRADVGLEMFVKNQEKWGKAKDRDAAQRRV